MLAFYLMASLIIGGILGAKYGDKDPTLKVEQVEPAFYGPNAHRELLKTCSRACNATGAKFKSYNSIAGECICHVPKKKGL